MPLMMAPGRPPTFDRNALARRIEGAMKRAAELAMELGITDGPEISAMMVNAKDEILAREGRR